VRRRVVALLVAVAALSAPAGALAHPLGNFTVNRFAAVEASASELYVHYALDLAEIPAYQEGARVRAPGYAAELARKLELRVDGQRAKLAPIERRVQRRPGAGGLETLRFDAVFRADRSGRAVTLADHTFDDRIGWREIVVRARDGARISAAGVPSESRSDELRAYPSDLLRSPLDVRSASATIEPGDGPGTPPSLSPVAPAAEHRGGGFEALVSHGDLSIGVILVSLLVAAFWGAAHALTPGHGKAIVAGYLVGTRGRPLDAVLLGGIVTVTHTIGVFALGLVTLLLSAFIVPEALYPWLTLVSGVLVVGVGASVLVSRRRGRAAHHHHHHDHGHRHHHGGGHDHSHAHHHEHVERRGLIGVGVAAGLLPCPSALVVLLSAIALHRVGFGLALITAFSLGLACTITGIGLVAVLAKRLFARVSLEGRIVRALPAASALAILVVGVVLTARAVPAVL
jgi:ABC-type nickel/cobalt efflux system permease component RcnA